VAQCGGGGMVTALEHEPTQRPEPDLSEPILLHFL